MFSDTDFAAVEMPLPWFACWHMLASMRRPLPHRFSNRLCGLSCTVAVHKHLMVDVRWDLDDRNNYNNRIASWLATPAIVENVKFNGKTWVLAGMPMPKIKARTCFMVMEVCSRIWHCFARFSPCCPPAVSPLFFPTRLSSNSSHS